MTRVFQVETIRGNFDVSAASVYGEVITVLDPETRRRASGDRSPGGDSAAWTTDFLAAIEAHRFDPARDHLLIAGGLLPLCLAVSTLVAKYRRISMLVFNQRQAKYIAKVFDVDRTICGETGAGSDTSVMPR